jgi:hypothetical protein
VPGKIGRKDPSRRDRMIVCKPLNGRSIDNSRVAKPIFVTDQQVANRTVPTGRDASFLPFQALRARLPSHGPYGTQTLSLPSFSTVC